MLKDSNIDEGIEISEGNVVLDLNGKTVLFMFRANRTTMWNY